MKRERSRDRDRMGKITFIIFVFLVFTLSFLLSDLYIVSAQQAIGYTKMQNVRDTLSFRIKNVERITPVEDYRNPVWSPTKHNFIAFIGREGTFIFSPTDKKITKLTSEVAGFKFSWTRDGKSIIYRKRVDEKVMAINQIETETGRVSILAQSINLSFPQEVQPGIIQYLDDKRSKTLQFSKTTTDAKKNSFVYQENDQIFVVTDGITKQITKEDGKYFLPSLSPDGSKVLYQEIVKGLYVTDLQSGATIYLGQGDDATWSPDSKYIIYEITTDDGHSITSSELYIIDLYGQRSKLTNTPQLHEMRPSWSSDGKYIAFDADGAIYIAELITGK